MLPGTQEITVIQYTQHISWFIKYHKFSWRKSQGMRYSIQSNISCSRFTFIMKIIMIMRQRQKKTPFKPLNAHQAHRYNEACFHCYFTRTDLVLRRGNKAFLLVWLPNLPCHTFTLQHTTQALSSNIQLNKTDPKRRGWWFEHGHRTNPLFSDDPPPRRRDRVDQTTSAS